MNPPGLGRRVFAELFGTAFLVAVVIGSGIEASRLSPHDVGLQLFENAAATGAGLVALIAALQPISASFNPVVTLVETALGALAAAEAAALIGAQVLGGVLGAVTANLMFGLRAVTLSRQDRGGVGRSLGEVVATLGLVVVIFGVTRAGRSSQVAYVVGAYIAAAYWFTSSTSFANPAVTLARTLTDTFAGIAPATVPLYLGAQLLGGAAGLVAVRALSPHTATIAEHLTADVPTPDLHHPVPRPAPGSMQLEERG